MADNFNVATIANRISILGDLRESNMRRALAAIHNTVETKGYQDIELDFSRTTKTYAGPALAIAMTVQKLLQKGVDTSVTLPDNPKLQKLFLNANWAHLMDIRGQPPSNFRGHSQVPATKYSNADEQTEIVNRAVEVMLTALDEFDRSHLKAVEWAVNEITDNVINHAESSVGGVLQLSHFRNRQAIQYTVCDVGVGIPATLRSGHPEIPSDAQALDDAIREGITRDTNLGQGNGLFGSWKISAVSKGDFQIHSGNASLFSDQSTVTVHGESIPFHGTLVVSTIRYNQPLALEKALNFKGKAFDPVDFVENKYETDAEENVRFELGSESTGLGTRSAGSPVRQKLINLARICGGTIVVDFSEVPLLSSSYADEVFGKLFAELGAITFSNRFKLVNIDPTVRSLIERAIQQRVASGVSDSDPTKP